MTSSEIQALLRADNLDGAIANLNAEVKGNPKSIEHRLRLAELLCVAGNLDRADAVLDVVTNIDPGAMVGVALFRQLIRAEQARQQFYSEGRLPEFVTKPDAQLELELRACVCWREGAVTEMAKLLSEREEARIPLAGVADGAPFDDFRDLDDLCAAHLDVYSSTGKSFWIPTSSIASIELRKVETQRDLLWRRALVSVADGPDGEVFLPSIYVSREMTVAHRLGHVTDFIEVADRTVLGNGLRTFFVGEHSRTILQLGKLSFSAHAGSG